MRTIMFIHGMFLNPKSWQAWEAFFTARGYQCVAPPWPLHDGDPAELRSHVPPELGKLSLPQVIDAMQSAASKYDTPILIGHSVGGLLVQILAARGVGSVGVPICPVAPNRMMAADWGLLRNTIEIANPLKGDDPVPMDADGWYQNFGNTMDRAASDAAFETYAMHESRNVFRDTQKDIAKIDVERPHIPFLFVGADKDEIIPVELVERNAKAYTDAGSRSDFISFTDRGHYICGQPGWQDVASYIADWLEQVAPIQPARAAPLES